MPHAPDFWRRDGVLPRLLSPLAAITAAVTAHRVARPGWRAPVPVICCGNVTVGGAGKTTLALDLGTRLAARGRAVHFLLRGYRGAIRGPHRVAAADTAEQVGDEALLLAAVAPTWIGADRAAAARAAVAAGAQVLVLDDGLQNPGLHKDLSLLVVDGASGFGNGRVLPAGPVARAGRGRGGALPGRGADRARCRRRGGWADAARAARHAEAGAGDRAWIGRRVLPFAGIANPQRFFAMLAAAGAIVLGPMAFPDHHRFTRAGPAPRARRSDARRRGAAHHAEGRGAPARRLRDRIGVVGVSLAWDDPAALEGLLACHA